MSRLRLSQFFDIYPRNKITPVGFFYFCGARDWTTLAYGELSLGRRFGKESKLSFHSTPAKGELRSRLVVHVMKIK